MDHFEAGNHNIASQNIQISAYTSIPSNIQQPKVIHYIKLFYM